jgi:hypothetical protein
VDDPYSLESGGEQSQFYWNHREGISPYNLSKVESRDYACACIPLSPCGIHIYQPLITLQTIFWKEDLKILWLRKDHHAILYWVFKLMFEYMIMRRHRLPKKHGLLRRARLLLPHKPAVEEIAFQRGVRTLFPKEYAFKGHEFSAVMSKKERRGERFEINIQSSVDGSGKLKANMYIPYLDIDASIAPYKMPIGVTPWKKFTSATTMERELKAILKDRTKLIKYARHALERYRKRRIHEFERRIREFKEGEKAVKPYDNYGSSSALLMGGALPFH